MVGHISDVEFVTLLQNCVKLSKTIIIKDNYSNKEGFWFDEADGNVLRSLRVFEDIFEAAGVKIV